MSQPLTADDCQGKARERYTTMVLAPTLLLAHNHAQAQRSNLLSRSRCYQSLIHLVLGPGCAAYHLIAVLGNNRVKNLARGLIHRQVHR